MYDDTSHSSDIVLGIDLCRFNRLWALSLHIIKPTWQSCIIMADSTVVIKECSAIISFPFLIYNKYDTLTTQIRQDTSPLCRYWYNNGCRTPDNNISLSMRQIRHMSENEDCGWKMFHNMETLVHMGVRPTNQFPNPQGCCDSSTNPSIPNWWGPVLSWSWQLWLCNRCSAIPTAMGGLEVSGLHVKSAEWGGKELWGAWQRDAGHHESDGGVEAVLARSKAAIWDLDGHTGTLNTSWLPGSS